MNNQFKTLNSYYTERINSVLTQRLSLLPASLLKEAMSYSLLAGGKRIRPFLVYATGRMFDCKIENLDHAAAAIESIHTYSLIHDDLPAMDDDALRRGMPTCHIKFGEDQAILAGDALQTFAFSLLAQSPNLSAETKIAMVNELALSSGVAGMCYGQSLDLLSEHQKVTLEQLNQIHIHKTGALIKSAIRLGMLASGEIAKQYELPLNNYADAIGLAFQIQDDILDVIGDQSVMGKTQGADLQLEKSTYPALLGLENAITARNNIYKQAIDELAKIPYNSDSLRLLADFVIHRDN